MASGTYNLSLEHSSSSVSFQGKLEWTSTSNGSTANSSNVVVKLYARKQGSSQATSGTFKGSITIDGTKTTFSQNKSVQNSWVLISTSSKTVSHNANGTKSITIAGEVGSVSGTTLANIKSTGSTSITLDTIPRYATIQNVSITNDESPIYIDINTPAYSSYTSLQVCVSKDNYSPIDNWRTIPLSGTPVQMVSETYILNATELNSIYISNTTTNNATIYFIVRSTLNGTTQTSKVSKTLQIVNASPEFTSANMSYEDANSSIVAITGDNQKIVQSLSTLQINWTTPTFKKGATLQEMTFYFTGGVSDYFTSSNTSGNHTYSGTINGQNINVHITCEDSRGNYATPVDITIPVLLYQTPEISSYIRRENNYEDTTYIDGHVSISPVDSINSLQTFKYRYSQYGTGTWSAWSNLTEGTTETVSLNKDYQWEIQIEASDKFTTAPLYSYIVQKGVFPLFIDTDLNSVGINCFPTNYTSLESAYLILSRGTIRAIGDLETDSDIKQLGHSIFENKVLWSGGLYMNELHTATLTENVSSQRHGIVLVWSGYSGGVGNYNWHCNFVPKEAVALANSLGGNGFCFEMGSSKVSIFGTKYVYIYDDRIVGNADNTATGTSTGTNIKYTNNAFVLRYVIGV